MATHKTIAGALKAIDKETKKVITRKRSLIASTINKELTAGRKEVVESVMTKTGLKRKTLNDRLPISRANPKDEVIEGTITPIYGKRIYMTEYPFVKTIARGGKAVLRLTSPLYRKNMRTGFLSADGSRMYLRVTGDQRSSVRAVRGRSVPRLFEQFKIKETFETKIIERVRRALKAIL